MELKKLFGTDQEKEREGTWIDMGEGASMKVARMGNPHYNKTIQRLSKPHKNAIRRGTISEEKAQELQIRAAAEALLLDWKGIVEDGVEVAYSVDKGIEYMTAMNDFFRYVQEMATSIENFREEEDEEAEKN